MLNIHSFLQGTKKHVNNMVHENKNVCNMLCAYVSIGAILVLSSDRFIALSEVKKQEVYAETVELIKATAENEIVEGTMGEAQIQSKGLLLSIYEQQEEKVGQLILEDKLEKEIQIREERKKIQEEQEEIERKARKKAKEKAAKEKAAREKAEQEKAAAKKAQEERAALANQTKIQLSSADKEVLLRITEAEATGEDIKGRMLVANVILNRVNHSMFPNTVYDVVFQKNGGAVQFSPTSDGRYWSVAISEETRVAVDRVLNGEDESQGALYFSARSKADPSNMSWFDHNLKWLFQYGGHEFYSNY